MEIAGALADGLIEVTERLVDIVRSCTLCGICDKQCYFVTELRPLKVMTALKEYVEDYLRDNKPVLKPQEDDLLKSLKTTVGDEWATNDPAVLIAYSKSINPLIERKIPRYVVMPATKDQCTEITKIAYDHNTPLIPRGNGSIPNGKALGDGIIMDFNRMKRIEVDPDLKCAINEPGVTVFDLQEAANQHGLRANVAEAAACICANVISTNMHSLFSYAYGLGPDDCIGAEVLDSEGNAFHLSETEASTFFIQSKTTGHNPGLCTEMRTKLHPMTKNEESIMVPFADFRKAANMVRELGKRRIGFVADILGTEFVSAFMSPIIKAATDTKHLIKKKLDIEYIVLVLGNKHDIELVNEMAEAAISHRMIRLLILGMSGLDSNTLLDLLGSFTGGRELYQCFPKDDMLPLMEAALSPSPESIANMVDEDMRDFYKKLYSRPEMTDLVWQNMYRILSARMGRQRAHHEMVLWAPLDKPEIIIEVCEELKAIADKHNVKNDFGHLVPVSFGERARIEYDYYYDHTNEFESKAARLTALEATGRIEEYTQRIKELRFPSGSPCGEPCKKESLSNT